MAIAPDGTWLATGGWDETVRIWAANGRHRATLTGHEGTVHAVAIAPNGTWLATTGSGDQTVRIWTVEGTDIRSATAIRLDGAAGAGAWLPGTTSLVITGSRGIYRFSLHPPVDNRRSAGVDPA